LQLKFARRAAAAKAGVKELTNPENHKIEIAISHRAEARA
jgi:hypothetical protein